MSLKIAPDVQYLSRAEWGADESLPRLGEERPADEPTEAIEHHIVATDDDVSPNRWESVAEVIPRMRGMQTARPDLGLDVPYSYVAFMMQYAHKKGMILCEGRGPYRRGAHTKYHNRTGRAMAVYANTMIGMPLDPYVQMFSDAWAWIKSEHGLVNLGTVRPARGGVVFAHQDFPTATTLCPGDGMMAIVDQITVDAEEEPMPETVTRKLYHTWQPAKLWYVPSVAGVPMWRRWITTQAGAAKLLADPEVEGPETISLWELRTIPEIKPSA